MRNTFAGVHVLGATFWTGYRLQTAAARSFFAQLNLYKCQYPVPQNLHTGGLWLCNINTCEGPDCAKDSQLQQSVT